MGSTVWVKFLGKVCISKEECEEHFNSVNSVFKAIPAKSHFYFEQQTVERFSTTFLLIYTIEIISRDLMEWKECVEMI